MIYQLKEVRKEFLQPDGRFVLHVPELRVPPGGVCVFHGPSGCGKSTLFDMLGLISPPTSATTFEVSAENGRSIDLRACSEAVRGRVRSSLIGYVLQLGGLLPALTIAENISLPRRVCGLPVPRAEIAALAARLGIEEQLHKKPARLSGGQKQRAAIARALIHRPGVILADEPTGAVDPCLAEEIRDLLVSCAREQNTAVLVVTHDVGLFARQASSSFTFAISRHGQEVRSTLIRCA